MKKALLFALALMIVGCGGAAQAATNRAVTTKGILGVFMFRRLCLRVKATLLRVRLGAIAAFPWLATISGRSFTHSL